MYHVYSTAVTRRYVEVRGRALAISGFGMNAAEALFPVIVILGLSVFDWRFLWMMLPIFAFISFAPAIGFLTRRTPFQDGPGRTQQPVSTGHAEPRPNRLQKFLFQDAKTKVPSKE